MSESSISIADDSSTKTNEREVIDPITHLPLTIHDADTVELERIPPPPTSAEKKKLNAQRGANSKEEGNARHIDMENLVKEALNANWWGDPIGDQRRARLQTSTVAAAAAAVGAFSMVILWSAFVRIFGGKTSGIGVLGFFLLPFVCCVLGLIVGAAGMFLGLYQSSQERPDELEGETIDTQKSPHMSDHDEETPESANWLNSFLNAVWPIVNPSLFIAVADMLEDSMQATLPILVRNIRVVDIGQGSESMRILGIRLLNAGFAAKDVDEMKAEEGDFVNMEVAIAYRAKETTVSGIRSRAANAHLLMEFWLTGGMMIPVWVELTGFLATVRVRFQLTPNPPFLSFMTVTLLGLPKVTLKCTPLAKNFLNIMDVPGLSHWIQKSINLAVEKYVAPRSLTIDLKTLLMGRPKMDTEAKGVVIVTVRRVEGCHSDSANFLTADDSGKKGDLYVTLGWSKWGKPLWSTRIISGMAPVWEETTAVLVGPSEIHGQEGIQLQVWDSDRFTVDDLMGSVELSLQDLMSSDSSLNRMCVRQDRLVGERGKPRLGTLHWECGYFSKTSFEQHLQHKPQNADNIRTNIEREAEDKLREPKTRSPQTEDDEITQQKKEDMEEKTDELVATSKPTSAWPSGILSIKIEQISGLEIEKIKESGVREDAENEEDEDLPSSYCTVILNDQRVYKTRTKMKSNNPFFAAGTEKFIRDWQTTNVMISVRDSRIHEIDPVIGIVVLPLRDVFKCRSEVTDSFPLVGGIGYGRVHLSLVFRSVQLRLPKRLLGWDVGTLEILSDIKPSSDLPQEYNSCRLFLQTLYGHGKMVPNHAGEGWSSKKGKPIRLAVKKRYSSCLMLHLRKHAVGTDLTPAFATLWFKEIPDNETLNLSLPVYENTGGAFKDSQRNAVASTSKQVGTFNLTVRFWPGLSGYHKILADHDSSMANVMEVLDYVEMMQAKRQKLSDDEAHTDSSLSDDEDSDNENKSKLDGLTMNVEPAGQFKDFRKHQGELHRKHRGLMQWKAMRNVAWIGRGLEHKASSISDSVKGTFKHQPYEAGLQKEV